MNKFWLLLSRFETFVLYVSGTLAIISFAGLMLAAKMPNGDMWNKPCGHTFIIAFVIWMCVMMTQDPKTKIR